MTVLITTGPAWEPLDTMRRLTNASTGRLGSLLGDAFSAAGHRVVLFRGEGATAAPPRAVAAMESFSTNDDLAARLASWGRRETVHAVLHAAALCDFRVARVFGPDGRELAAGKIPSRAGPLRVELEATTKVLPRLRGWFPGARIVGWKYEADGGRTGALAAVARQFAEAGVDACVLNGPAWGEGFALCRTPADFTPCADAAALAQELLGWLGAGTRR